MAATDSALTHKRMTFPTATLPRRVNWRNTAWVVGYHLVALLAVLPYNFSWTGVILLIVGDYVFGVLGINVCYHRLLAHRGFKVPKWLERTLVTLAVCCVQDTPARWVATHRRHHEHADSPPDPHSPLVSFFWAHMEWVMIVNRDLNHLGVFGRYAKDILRDPYYKWLERGPAYLLVILASWILFFGGGFVAELMLGGTLAEAVQFGASVTVWGVFVRTVVVWHQTWAVNSVTHLWGYRNYETDEGSRNHLLVAVVSNGEGWHNNHHADPRAASHGHRAHEVDVTYMIVRLMEKLGLASRVIRPNPRLVAGKGRVRVTTRREQDVPMD